MKKFNVKAFTLVEMLIVIVIIGILIAALLPRMQSAQGRARDVARKSDLSQIGNGIIAYQTDKGKRPGLNSGAKLGTGIATIEKELIIAGMSSVPKDPNGSNKVKGLGTGAGVQSWDYAYLIAKKSGIANGGFVLMTRTETEAASNRLVNENAQNPNLSDGRIKNNDDLLEIHLCKTFELVDDINKFQVNKETGGICRYTEAAQLRYILTF